MKYTECANGHVYDADTYSVCPYCNNLRMEIQFAADGGGDVGKTVAPGTGVGGAVPGPAAINPDLAPGGYAPNPGRIDPVAQTDGTGKTVAPNDGRIDPVAPTEGIGKTVAPDVYRKKEEASNKTVAVFQHKHGIDPVVGWLVCIEGPDKGSDYRLWAKINTIGRGDSNDVCVKGDMTISGQSHARLAYDERHNNYQFLPGTGSSINYINDEPVYASAPLAAYDVIDMGESKFIFLPLCGEHFQWETEKKE